MIKLLLFIAILTTSISCTQKPYSKPSSKETYVIGGENDTKERQVINMSGTLKRIGKSGIVIELEINSKITGVVQFAMMKHDKEPGIEFPEIKFIPGPNKIKFKGDVLGWHEKWG